MSGKHHVDVLLFVQPIQGFDTVSGKHESVPARAYCTAHALQHKRLKIRFVVHHQDLARTVRQVQISRCHLRSPVNFAVRLLIRYFMHHAGNRLQQPRPYPGRGHL